MTAYTLYPSGRHARTSCIAAMMASALLATTATAADLTDGNLVISSYNKHIYEYTPAGQSVQNWAAQYPGGYPATEYNRDVAISSGQIHMYNGTFYPYQSTLNPNTGDWTHRSCSGLSTVNNGSYGGIAANSRYVYMTDMATSGASASGIVRFDLTTGSAERFATDIEPIDLNMGLNGLLYALSPGGSPGGRSIDVYNAWTLQHLRTLDLTATLGWSEHRALAVNTAGEIFLADWDNDLQRLDPNGKLLSSINLYSTAGANNLYDLDVSRKGMLVVTDWNGHVVVTNQAFSSMNVFHVGSNGNFVTIVPEPASLLLVLAAARLALTPRPRRHRDAGAQP